MALRFLQMAKVDELKQLLNTLEASAKAKVASSGKRAQASGLHVSNSFDALFDANIHAVHMYYAGICLYIKIYLKMYMQSQDRAHCCTAGVMLQRQIHTIT